MSATHQVQITVVGWLDFKVIREGIKKMQIPAPTELFAEFVRFLHTEKIFPAVRGGSGGPSFMQHGYHLADCAKIERWLESHGLDIAYMTKEEPTTGVWQFNENGDWIDDDPLNPCRVPPGYTMLLKEDETQDGDIYWHPAWTKWLPLTSQKVKVKTLNLPVARKSV